MFPKIYKLIHSALQPFEEITDFGFDIAEADELKESVLRLKLMIYLHC